MALLLMGALSAGFTSCSSDDDDDNNINNNEPKPEVVIKLVSDKDIMNEQMKLFLTTLSDYDGSNSDGRDVKENKTYRIKIARYCQS